MSLKEMTRLTDDQALEQQGHLVKDLALRSKARVRLDLFKKQSRDLDRKSHDKFVVSEQSGGKDRWMIAALEALRQILADQCF